jgi:type II secretory pathway pseudopilin PulG
MKMKGIVSVDLIIYMIVIGILMAVALPNASHYLDKGRRSKAMGEITLLASAVSMYHQYMGNYPDSLNVLTNTNPFTNVPWINNFPKTDPYGVKSTGINGSGGTCPYAYSRSDEGFAIWCFGKNKSNNSGGSGSKLPSSFGGDDFGYIGQ